MKMRRNKFVILTCFVFFSCFVYVNADLNLQEYDIDETRNSQQNSGVNGFANEEIHPPQRAGCSCTNGECVEEGGKDVCKCLPGFGKLTSSYCKACDCGPNISCSWKSTGWISTEKTCFCDPGYSENDGKCVATPCSSNPCKNGGTCTASGSKFTCSCVEPYSGLTCEEIDPCSSNPCKNGGKCTASGTNFTCSCVEPYAGLTCEKKPCAKQPCKNGGTCVVGKIGFICKCQTPFSGQKCEIDPCTTNPCQNNGTCKVDGQSYRCSCKKPFNGANCETGPCSSNPCQNGGNCSVDKMSYKCECKPPYAGDNCEKDPCSSNPCQNGGTCNVVGQKFKCSCKSPFKGNLCEIGPCSSNPCQNGGKCSLDGKNFKCDCQPPFKGDKCEKDPCTPSPCQNGGTCKIKGNTYSCDCSQDFVGDKCQHDCDCKNGKCRVTSDGEVVCECLPEYGMKSDVCEACDCGTGANCTFESGIISFFDTKYCLCPDGSKLKDQHCEDPCKSSPCLNNGKCKVEGKIFKCECTPPYTGPTCKDDLCTENPCRNGGTCKLNGTSFQCECKAPYSGKLCDEDPCKNNPCMNGGTCQVKGNSFKCACKTPYSGDKCEKDPCTSNPCMNGGTCQVKGNSFKCACKTPYSGDKCEKDPCTDNPCENGGTCSLSQDSFKCICKEQFGGDRCDHELSTTSIETTTLSPKTTGPTISTTELILTTSPLMSTSQITNDSTSSYFTEEINETTSEPSNLTQDFNWTTYEPSNFTVDFNWTTYEPSNLTQDFNWTTYEPSNFTVDFNGTTYEPPNSTLDINITTYEPSNFTNDLNLTTYEPSNFTYDINMTSYEPYNITSENNSSETTQFISSTSTPSTSTTTKKPGVCDNNPCRNGGTCREEKGTAKCVCPPQYSGENCTDTRWCTEGEGKELCQGGGCTFDFQTKVGRCTCPDDMFYNYERKQCEVVDRCPFISKKCNEANNEVCKNGECQCKEDFKLNNANRCVPNFCALNPCKENEDCEDMESDPGYVKCTCKEGYIFNGDYCMEDNVCSIPSQLKCQQLCDIDTQSCDCYSGFVLQSDNTTCVRENSTQLCSMDCGVGTCVETNGDDSCLCPPTHTFNGSTCIDLCTAKQIPEGLCPKNACVLDKELVFKCKCDEKFTYDKNEFTCRRKSMCTEGGGKEVCKKRGATCMEDFNHPDGFICKCEKGLDLDTDGTCKRKCDLPSQKEKCRRKGAVCDMDGFDAICRCPPLLTFDPEGRCSDFVNASYSGEIVLSLERYSLKKLLSPSSQAEAQDDSINVDLIRQDLRDSMHLLYGKKYYFADVLNCRIVNKKLKCLVELQFESDPLDQVKLIIDSHSCVSVDTNTCFIPPKLLIDKESQKSGTFAGTDPCSKIISKDYCSRDTECKRKQGLSFECACATGLESYSSYKPLSDPNTLIHRCQDIDECKEETACPNTTTCFNFYRNYECRCLKGFKPPAENPDFKQSGCVDVCSPNPCKHGKCEIIGDVVGCKCDGGYTGFDCNQVIINTAEKEGMKIALIVLAVLVVPLFLLSAFLIWQFKVVKRKLFQSGFFDDQSSTINLQPIRSGRDEEGRN